jgi:transcriptional regulator GlxA family with amidase domain
MNGQLVHIQDWEGLAREARFRPADMAALCPTSLRQLERFFENRFQQTPSEWTRELRCRLARQLISQGWSNKAVAEELGFVDPAHLCHEFKRILGVPPRNFAPRWGQEVNSRSNTRTSPNTAIRDRPAPCTDN